MKTRLHNNPVLKTLRQKLRKNLTKAEGLVWNFVRNRQIQGLRFFRQYSFGRYILDFYCPAIKLAVEIDGGQHDEAVNKQKDIQRTDYLNSAGVKVIRFWNNEVLKNPEGTYQIIIDAVNSSLPS